MLQKSNKVQPIEGLPTPVDSIKYIYPTDEEALPRLADDKSSSPINIQRRRMSTRLLWAARIGTLVVTIVVVLLWGHKTVLSRCLSSKGQSQPVVKSDTPRSGSPCHNPKASEWKVTTTLHSFPTNAKNYYFVSIKFILVSLMERLQFSVPLKSSPPQLNGHTVIEPAEEGVTEVQATITVGSNGEEIQKYVRVVTKNDNSYRGVSLSIYVRT